MTDNITSADFELENFKARKAEELEMFKAHKAAGLEMDKSVIAAGQAGLKAALLINGGGAISLLSFIGHMYDKSPNVTALASAMLWFCFGVLFAAIASGITYIAQWNYAKAYFNKQNETIGHA